LQINNELKKRNLQTLSTAYYTNNLTCSEAASYHATNATIGIKYSKFVNQTYQNLG